MRIAILGAGFMGSTHARGIKTLSGVEIAGIYGLTENRAKPLAAEMGSDWSTDLDRFIDDPTVDAVDICLPGPIHRDVTERAIAAGKHVLLEKPIAISLADADALVALAETTDRVFMIAHVLRFWPEYVELQRLATSGAYGKPVSAVAYRRQPFPSWSSLFASSANTGGAVIDMLIHDYDALNWIFGQPRSVACRGRRNPKSSGGFDQLQVMINYGDASAVVDGGMMMPETYPFTSSMQVLCETGAIEYMLRAGGRSVEMAGGTNDLRLYPNEGEQQKIEANRQDAYAAEIAYFAECVASGARPVRATPRDARLALKVALAARESIERDGLVAVDVEE